MTSFQYKIFKFLFPAIDNNFRKNVSKLQKQVNRLIFYIKSLEKRKKKRKIQNQRDTNFKNILKENFPDIYRKVLTQYIEKYPNDQKKIRDYNGNI